MNQIPLLAIISGSADDSRAALRPHAVRSVLWKQRDSSSRQGRTGCGAYAAAVSDGWAGHWDVCADRLAHPGLPRVSDWRGDGDRNQSRLRCHPIGRADCRDSNGILAGEYPRSSDAGGYDGSRGVLPVDCDADLPAHGCALLASARDWRQLSVSAARARHI